MISVGFQAAKVAVESSDFSVEREKSNLVFVAKVRQQGLVTLEEGFYLVHPCGFLGTRADPHTGGRVDQDGKIVLDLLHMTQFDSGISQKQP